MIKICIGFLIVLQLIYQLFKGLFGKFFFVPTNNWREKIRHVIEYPTPIYMNVGIKRSGFRRRLITASKNPSYYTNFLNNKIKIFPEDAKNENNEFTQRMKRRAPNDASRKIIYGFFHPYANNGGGGERVLWQAVKATLLASEENIAVIYCSDTSAEPLAILNKAKDKFNISGIDSKRIVFIYLRKFPKYIDGNFWKHFTLLGQLLGSALLSLEAMYELSPDIWVDTQGLPGSYFFACNGLKIPILSYVHYPIIQPEMFHKLKYLSFSLLHLRKFTFALKDIAHILKLVYWTVLLYFYKYLASLADITLANGSWTFKHINKIFTFNRGVKYKMDILFPPCGTEDLLEEAQVAVKQNVLIYVAQFRPEKRHELILKEYASFIEETKQKKITIKQVPRLILLGSCRTKDDTAVLQFLQDLVKELEIEEYVDFEVDCSYEELVSRLSSSKIGINAMWNEHFGIGVVEYVCRGAICLCHASAGPLLDILANDNDESELSWDNGLGFFFKDESDFDFDVNLQKEAEDGFLLFRDAKDESKLVRYPKFSKALSLLFIEQPHLTSDSELIERRRECIESIKEKFSNKTFVEKWILYSQDLHSIEINYRENRMESPNNVY